MAKATKSISFKNAVINTEDMTIIEITKDDECVYSLKKILNDWNGIEGISLVIKQENNIPVDDEDDIDSE